MIAGVVARRTMAPTLVAAAGGLVAAAFAVLLSARRSFGRCTASPAGDRLRLGDGRAEISRRDVRAWTLDGGVARVYTAHAGWRVAVPAGEGASLDRILRSVFGSPLILRRRGSARARKIAAGVAAAGAGLVATSFALEIVPLVVVGVPALIFGLATFGALSQKVGAGGR
jgi:hypothetical protein